ncbi:MAG: hypothetical protein ACRDN0_00065 [Trebonia sp.]
MAVAVVPVIIAALLATLVAYIQNRQTQPAPSIEVDGVAIQPAETYPDPFKLTFEVRNTGNQLAIIRGAQLRITQFTSLPICLSQGDLPVTGTYRANIPTVPRPGTTIDVPVSQQIGPDAADEFQLQLRNAVKAHSLTVGIYRMDVSLLYDNSSAPVNAGNVIMALPFDPNYQYVWTRTDQHAHGNNMEFMGDEFPGISQCLVGNAKHLGAVLSLAGQRSPNLTSLQAQLAYCCTLGYPTVAAARCTGQKPLVRPSSLPIACDGSGELEEIHWRQWDFSQATGSGIFNVDSCQPNCATGKFQNYPVTIRFSQPAYAPSPNHSGWVWNYASVTFTKEVPSGMHPTEQYASFAPES